MRHILCNVWSENLKLVEFWRLVGDNCGNTQKNIQALQKLILMTTSLTKKLLMPLKLKALGVTSDQ